MIAFRPLSLSALAALQFALSGCAVVESYQKHQARVREERVLAELRSAALAEHAAFRAAAGWKKKTYRNEAVLALASPENVSVEIALNEQRGLLLVRGGIAMDFPVATGRKSHPTPPGSYTVRGKEKDYHSNLYGKILDAAGTIVVADADTRTDIVPEGGSFTGSSMPYWMRLTDSGVGMHVGYVPGGRAASHGCIRLRRETAAKLFGLVKVGTPVIIADEAPALAAKKSR